MSDENEKLLTWEDEAKAIINDIENFVTSISVSTTLEVNERCIYLNVKTLEGKEFCVELSNLGFRVAGEKFDSTDESSEHFFDTPYALLSSISPGYESKFASSLAAALNEISE